MEIEHIDVGREIEVEYESAYGGDQVRSGSVVEAHEGGASLYHVWFVAEDGTKHRLTGRPKYGSDPTLHKDDNDQEPGPDRRLSVKGGVSSIEVVA